MYNVYTHTHTHTVQPLELLLLPDTNFGYKPIIRLSGSSGLSGAVTPETPRNTPTVLPALCAVSLAISSAHLTP